MESLCKTLITIKYVHQQHENLSTLSEELQLIMKKVFEIDSLIIQLPGENIAYYSGQKNQVNLQKIYHLRIYYL